MKKRSNNNTPTPSDLIIFTSGVELNRVYAHRGDIFTCEGVFKRENKVDKEDHILCKPSRPVLVVSDDAYNKTIVKVLPLSTSCGNSDPNSMTNSRCIQIPAVDSKRDGGITYIDVSQEFTVNVHQLRYKLATVSQEIVDTAVAYNLLQKINYDSVDNVVNIIKKKYPDAECFNNVDMCACVDDRSAPYIDVFSSVKQIKDSEKPARKNDYPPHSTYEEVDELYKEWINIGTEAFRYKYSLDPTQYNYLRNSCIKKLLGVKQGFTKFDWR